ncbi:anti-sigma factor antagonist [Streptomyces sp. NPDC050738]|uniref:anti-sigma factor antagonist n=1 Tax=Streptomyces sp. NPDC050738 TaxID=3154744 RepID=UPI00344493A9
MKDLPGLLPDSGQSAFSYVVSGFTVVEFHGEIDVATGPGVRPHLDAATALPGARLIVDLGPATFIDCSALALLCRARRRVRARDGTMAVVCTNPWHLRILRGAGLGDSFRVVGTVADALIGWIPHQPLS